MTTTSRGTRTTPATDALRLLLEDVLRSVSADDADRYAGDGPAGGALLALSALARRAAAALATEAGGRADGAPGSAVLQEFEVAVGLLGDAADAAHGESWRVADLLVRAEHVRARRPGRGR